MDTETHNRTNYQKLLERYLENAVPGEKLFLHCCCAPCSSYVLEYLSDYFEITVFFYNPNLFPQEEYLHRKEELMRLISEMDFRYPVHVMDADYDHSEFLEACGPYSDAPEGGARCLECFRLRLGRTAASAAEFGYGLMCTTLTISPLKNSNILNAVGMAVAAEHGIRWLPSDFKKRGGYQRSIELCRLHSIYRQNYCGCEFSRREQNERGDQQ